MIMINRKDLVRRHNPVLHGFTPRSPLSVGNGEFAFTADITGLQSFPELHDAELSGVASFGEGEGLPLCTQAQWGWHTEPLQAGFQISDYKMQLFDTHGRKVGYPTSGTGQEYLHGWLRNNPHRLHLGRIGFRFRGENGGVLSAECIEGAVQTLDLWSGVLESVFRVEKEPVTVRVCCHPQKDGIAVQVESGLLADGRIEVLFAFPYGSPGLNAADWSGPDRHTTILRPDGDKKAVLERRLDNDEYSLAVSWGQPAAIDREGEHLFVVRPQISSSAAAPRFEFQSFFYSGGTAETAAAIHSSPGNKQTFDACEAKWHSFWSDHGAIELADSKDERAIELERRIILSQYITAIQCCGSLPPQETGLTCNSWGGKFHLEMHWWHAVHFPLWGRAPLLERSMHYYQDILQRARDWASYQGYKGARWPKMVGPEGRDGPSSIAPMLIWQQPHPIVYSELLYMAEPNKATLEKYAEIVFETADFMASFAWLNPNTNSYDLGPPVIPAQEAHKPKVTWNPTYELEYWAHALEIAQLWRERLGMKPDPDWHKVRTGMAALPEKDGVYLAHENCPETFAEKTHDHPSMLAALGLLPGAHVDKDTMGRTLDKVLATWNWERTWGWDFPMAAMTATRLGVPQKAVDALLLDTPRNHYLANGHNAGMGGGLIYIPGNGGILTAVAMMAAGWMDNALREKIERGETFTGSETSTGGPGFPDDGSWTVVWEGLNPWL